MLFAFVGNAGQVILFVITLALWSLLAIYSVIFSCRNYLVVVQGTAAGLDKVTWPEEPTADWLLQSLPPAGLLALWLVPAGFLARALDSVWLQDEPVLRVLLLAGPVLWFFFPLSLLSSMGSTSRWQILNGQVLLGLLRLFPSLVIFYAVTAGIFVAGAGLAYLGLFTSGWYALPLACCLGAAGVLIHARLVGRLGWQLQQLRTPPVKRPRKNRPAKRRSRAVAVNDPWAAREADDDPSVAPRFQAVEQPEPKKPRPAYLDPEPEPYTFAETEAVETVPCAPRLELNEEQVKHEIELRTRTPPNPPPKSPMFSGVWTFPFYSTTLKELVTMTLVYGFCGATFRLMASLFPG